MAKYSYNELKRAAAEGRRIGGWNNRNVYACSKYDYDASKTNYYVLYDDGNKLVREGYVYGTIDDKGAIDECARWWYNVPLRRTDKVTRTVPATSGYSDMVVADDFFVRIDREINELLTGVAELKFDQEFKI